MSHHYTTTQLKFIPALTPVFTNLFNNQLYNKNTPYIPALYIIPFSALSPYIPLLNPWLNTDEQNRHTIITHATTQKRFTIIRACVRLILMYYLNCSAHAISWRYSPLKKPYNDLPLHAAWSYSKNHGAIFINTQQSSAVDIEDVARFSRFSQTRLQNLATMICTTEEYNQFQHIRTHEQQIALLAHFWTFKEALIKSYGGSIIRDAHMHNSATTAQKAIWTDGVTYHTDATYIACIQNSTYHLAYAYTHKSSKKMTQMPTYILNEYILKQLINHAQSLSNN